MSNELSIIRPQSLAEAKDLAQTLSSARTIPEALQKSPADVLAIVMAGAELGLAPMQSIRALLLIKGKPTLAADAMGALVKSRRDVCQYLLLKHSDGARAAYETQRVGDPSPTSMAFTIEDAKQAGLAGGDNWRKFPAAMLRARALSAICRAVYPDLLLGVYDPDELAPEKDATPTSGADAVEAVKAKVRKARMMVVDAPPPAPTPTRPAPTPPALAAGEPTVGWGKHAARTLASLTDVEAQWYLSEAGEAACRKATGDYADAHLADYRAEAHRRLAAAGQAEVAS
jgi:hypothetical protein